MIKAIVKNKFVFTALSFVIAIIGVISAVMINTNTVTIQENHIGIVQDGDGKTLYVIPSGTTINGHIVELKIANSIDPNSDECISEVVSGEIIDPRVARALITGEVQKSYLDYDFANIEKFLVHENTGLKSCNDVFSN